MNYVVGCLRWLTSATWCECAAQTSGSNNPARSAVSAVDVVSSPARGFDRRSGSGTKHCFNHCLSSRERLRANWKSELACRKERFTWPLMKHLRGSEFKLGPGSFCSWKNLNLIRANAIEKLFIRLKDWRKDQLEPFFAVPPRKRN